MEIVWIYYGFIYAIANSIVWISLFFPSALSLGRLSGACKRPNYRRFMCYLASRVDSIGECFFRKNNI
jgi:hypothetical protein